MQNAPTHGPSFALRIAPTLYATEDNVSTSANWLRQSGTHCQQPPPLTLNR